MGGDYFGDEAIWCTKQRSCTGLFHEKVLPLNWVDGDANKSFFIIQQLVKGSLIKLHKRHVYTARSGRGFVKFEGEREKEKKKCLYVRAFIQCHLYNTIRVFIVSFIECHSNGVWSSAYYWIQIWLGDT